MGFGEGFGAGFTTAFNKQRDRSHERETDEFRYRMETLIKKKEKYDEYKREDTKNANLAKQIVEYSGAPPEAVGEAYKSLRDGMDYGDVLKLFQGGKFKVNPKDVKKPEDKQMEESGLAVSADSAQVAPPAPAPGLDGGGLLSQVFPGMKKFAPQPRAARVESRVAQTSGMTPEEIAQVDAGYQPQDMDTGSVSYQATPEGVNDPVEAKRLYDEARFALQQDPQNAELQANADSLRRQYESVVAGTQVKANAGGFGQTPASIGTMDIVVTKPDGTKEKAVGQMTADGSFLVDGQPVNARARSDDEKEREEKIIATLGEPAQKHMESSNELAQAYIAYGNARKIIEDNPDVINERTAGIDQYFVDLGKDFEAGMKLVKDTLANPENANPSKLEQAKEVAEDAANNVNLGPMQKLAAAKGLLNVQYALAAYHLAAAKNLDGRNLSKEEREHFIAMPNQFTDIPTWDQGIGAMLVPEKQAMDKLAQLLPRQNLDYQRFLEDYGYSPVGEIASMEAFLEGTEGANLDRLLPQSGYEAIKSPAEKNEKLPKAGAPAEYPGYEYTGKKTKDGKPLYKDENGVVGTMD